MKDSVGDRGSLKESVHKFPLNRLFHLTPWLLLFSSSGAPEEPFLVQDGKRIHPGNNVLAKENHTVTVECVARRAVPEVKQVFWSLGPDHINVTGNSELKIDFVSHEDSYTTKSILRLNTTRTMNHQKVTCHVFHVAWPNASVVSASLNVLCEYFSLLLP